MLTVSAILLVLGLVFLAVGILAYFVLYRMEKKNTSEEIVKKLFKNRKIKNPTGLVDLLHVIFLAVVVLGFTLILIAILVSATV